MVKLNAIVALETGQRQRTYTGLTEADRQLQLRALTSGQTRVYTPKEDSGEQLPPESQLVQVRVPEKLRDVSTLLGLSWNNTATKEWSNQTARADVVLDDDTIILSDVPIAYLLFLEKQLTDLHTFIGRLPTLDPAYEWTFDDGSNAWRTDPVTTNRSQKVPRVITKAPATTEHPAQTELFTEDVVVGTWSTTHLSGAVQATERVQMLERVDELRRAVKVARETANDMNVTRQEVAEPILRYALGSMVE